MSPESHLISCSVSSIQTEIIRSDEILDGHLTMKEVCRIYGLYSKVNNMAALALSDYQKSHRM